MALRIIHPEGSTKDEISIDFCTFVLTTNASICSQKPRHLSSEIALFKTTKSQTIILESLIAII